MTAFHVTVQAFGSILSESVEADSLEDAKQKILDRIGFKIEAEESGYAVLPSGERVALADWLGS